ncbi:hypothetical protein VTO42DRAFT_2720 [Malbranchea cinnamomea]
MHELLLFAQVPASQHHVLLQQLSGLTAMQPNRTFERRLIFRPYRKPGFLRPRPGGSQDVQPSEVQRLHKMLNAGLYHMHVVGAIQPTDFGANEGDSTPDTLMGGMEPDGAVQSVKRGTGYVPSNQMWRVEFRDTPEAGTGSGVTSRVVSTAVLPYGNVLPAMKAWGFDYVSEYVVEGNMFILDDTVLFLHRVLNFPPGYVKDPTRPTESLPPLDQMMPLDPSGSYILQASITVQDVNPDMLKAAAQRLLRLKDHLKPVVKLEPADRLSLDTRVK